ncbi:SCP2 sterol-binding domain-containing protein [Stackebrandtia soli]|uniref:SCP2 sterol-binding domain-containing protein n=1 Tax=Stackebrandtia soli TaxID=1892856 RepID=UPI0039EBBB2E
MATIEECRTALNAFAANIAENSAKVQKKVNFDRKLACDITDLDVSFNGRFKDGALVDIADGDAPDAQIRLTTTSDDLVAFVDGSLDFAKAFASGRVKVKANLMDLLKLKGMM